MKVLVCIDDTDNLETEWGTGKLASLLAEAMEAKGWGSCEHVTRHQLLVHPDIPYTSHNSCMCFAADMKPDHINDFIGYAEDFLLKESAPGSDPGLCVAIPEKITQPGWLIAFGYSAKQQILTKEDAYMLAEELDIHLSEHGGTGQGVIGALAGTGLRLSGNDGRFRGKMKMDTKDGVVSVQEILTQTHVDLVRSLEDGYTLPEDEYVVLGDTVKSVLIGGKSVLLVNPLETQAPRGAKWQTCSKNQIKAY